MNTDRVKHFARLDRKRKQLEAAAKELKKEIDQLKEGILEEMQAEGVPHVRVTLDGQTFTVYLRSQLWAKASGGDYRTACTALVAAGYGDFVQERFNTNSVSALVREMREAAESDDPTALKPGDYLPGDLATALDVAETWDVRCVIK